MEKKLFLLPIGGQFGESPPPILPILLCGIRGGPPPPGPSPRNPDR